MNRVHEVPQRTQRSEIHSAFGMSPGDLVLAAAEAAARAGASGVAIERNLWDHPSPPRMIAAGGLLGHDGGTVDEALRELG